jgi:hypothetical protein
MFEALFEDPSSVVLVDQETKDLREDIVGAGVVVCLRH